ncbi:MAG: DUF3106 domain-containing protein [Pseudomonadota bacterium]
MKLALHCLLGVLLLSSTALAQDWGELNEQQQQTLARWQSEWPTLSIDARRRLLNGAERWDGMTEQEQRDVLQRFERWQQLSEEEKQLLRDRSEQFQALEQNEREQAQSGFQRWQALTPEQRERLRQRWQQSTPEERRAFRAGMAIGNRMGAQQERNRWERNLNPEQRRILMNAVAPLSQAQRRQFRDRVQAMPAEQRRPWLIAFVQADLEQRIEMIKDAAPEEDE